LIAHRGLDHISPKNPSVTIRLNRASSVFSRKRIGIVWRRPRSNHAAAGSSEGFCGGEGEGASREVAANAAEHRLSTDYADSSTPAGSHQAPANLKFGVAWCHRYRMPTTCVLSPTTTRAPRGNSSSKRLAADACWLRSKRYRRSLLRLPPSRPSVCALPRDEQAINNGRGGPGHRPPGVPSERFRARLEQILPVQWQRRLRGRGESLLCYG